MIRLEDKLDIEEQLDVKVLRRVPFTTGEPLEFPIVLDPSITSGIIITVLDTETTGLDYEKDEIIELGLVKILYCMATNTVGQILDAVSLFEQPSKPITQEIIDLTHITNEMVEGLRIDNNQVERILSDTQLVVAHNAKFDRPFFDKRFENLRHLAWACTMEDVDWASKGFEGRSLVFLMMQAGYFYGAHRADIDCLATMWLLKEVEGAFPELLENSLKTRVRVRCFTAPFHVKDELKAMGYRWQAEASTRHWMGECPENEWDEEHAKLSKLCPTTIKNFVVESVTRHNRFQPS